MKLLPKRKNMPPKAWFDRDKTLTRKIISREDLESIHCDIAQLEYITYNFLTEGLSKGAKEQMRSIYYLVGCIREILHEHGIGGNLLYDKGFKSDPPPYFSAIPHADTHEAVKKILHKGREPRKTWQKLVSFLNEQATGLVGKKTLEELIRQFESLDVKAAIQEMDSQLRRKWQKAPPSKGIGFLFLGLFDAVVKGEEKVGFYVSGGPKFDPEDEDTLCDQSYMPRDRFLNIPFLDSIKQLGESCYPIEEFTEYAVMLGAAAILVKFSELQELKKFKLVAGFDSGDFLEVN